MGVLVRWLMLIMFVRWGVFFIFVLFRFRTRREPEGRELHRCKGQDLEGHESRSQSSVILLVFYAIGVGKAR
jgi:hypothetical protein